MMSKTSILVVGDPGPVRHELLIRSDLQLWWMTRMEEVRALLAESRPAVCIISPEIEAEEALAVLEAVRMRSIPVIAVVDPYQPIDPRITALAAALVPRRRVDCMLAIVSLHTGLRFAKDPRARVEALARVYIGRDEHVLESTNISVSGVALRRFPAVPVGTTVHVELELEGATVVALARVVRFGFEDGSSVAGLEFVRIARAQRERIMHIVESARKETRRPELRMADLFGDLTVDMSQADALETGDITLDVSPPIFDFDEALDTLARWVSSDSCREPIPAWMASVAEELTPLERAAIQSVSEAGDFEEARVLDGAGDADPLEWVLDALRLRLVLARYRSETSESGKLPAALADAGYRMFVKLAEHGAGAPDTVVTQIARIRAALLRDLLAGGPRPRSGVAEPHPASLDLELPEAGARTLSP